MCGEIFYTTFFLHISKLFFKERKYKKKEGGLLTKALLPNENKEAAITFKENLMLPT